MSGCPNYVVWMESKEAGYLRGWRITGVETDGSVFVLTMPGENINSNMKTKDFRKEKKKEIKRLHPSECKAKELKWDCRLIGTWTAHLVPTEFVNKVVVSWEEGRKAYHRGKCSEVDAKWWREENKSAHKWPCSDLQTPPFSFSQCLVFVHAESFISTKENKWINQWT